MQFCPQKNAKRVFLFLNNLPVNYNTIKITQMYFQTCPFAATSFVYISISGVTSSGGPPRMARVKSGKSKRDFLCKNSFFLFWRSSDMRLIATLSVIEIDL